MKHGIKDINKLTPLLTEENVWKYEFYRNHKKTREEKVFIQKIKPMQRKGQYKKVITHRRTEDSKNND